MYARCHDLLSRAERRRARALSLRRAARALDRRDARARGLRAEMEKGALSGDFDALAGTEEARRSRWARRTRLSRRRRGARHLRSGCTRRWTRSAAFEAEVDEATARESVGQGAELRAFGGARRRGRDAREPERSAGADLARTLDFLKDLSFLRDVDMDGEKAKRRVSTGRTFGRARGRALKDATRTYDEWTRAMRDADAALRRARLLRSDGQDRRRGGPHRGHGEDRPVRDPSRDTKGEGGGRARAHRTGGGGQARGPGGGDRGVHQAQARRRVAAAAAEQELGRRRAAHVVRRGEGARPRVAGHDCVRGRVRRDRRLEFRGAQARGDQAHTPAPRRARGKTPARWSSARWRCTGT